MFRRWLAAVLFLLSTAAVLPAQPAPPAPPPSKPASENDALGLAVRDLDALDPRDWRFFRYIWVSSAEAEDLQAVALALNYISRGTVAIRPFPLGKENLMLARVDLRSYAPRDKDIQEFAKTWEELRFDPRFNLLITRDTLKFAAGIDLPADKKPPPAPQDKGAKPPIRKAATETAGFDENTDVLRVVGEHLNKGLVETLVQRTGSQAPVVSHKYFLARALTTVQGQGVAKVLYSGLYYRFADIRSGAKVGTDEDVLLEQLGVGNAEKGITAQQIFNELRSDQRAAVFRSKVTGKPRRIDVLRTLAGRDSQGIISITHDLRDDNIDLKTHPMLNLLEFKDDAREVIFEKPNGLQGFALFNGAGKLQDEVPIEVTTDQTIPAPNTPRLQPAISCIRCHGDSNGWKPVINDVTKLLSKRLDAFGDLTQQNKSQSDVIDRLAGLYGGNLELRLLPRARDDFNGAILRAAGPWKRSKDQTDLVKLSADRIAIIYNGYVYASVSAKDALYDLGVVVEDKDAEAALAKLLPPANVLRDGYVPEDGRIGGLQAGLELDRSDYDLCYGFMAARAARNRK